MVNLQYRLLLSLIALALTIEAAPAIATVVDCTRHSLADCNPARYTVEWFLTCPKSGHQQLITDRALFYSQNAGYYAKTLAYSSGQFYVTIWDVWQQWLYDQGPTGVLSCIDDDDIKHQYYSKMSMAFARLARGSATVMHLTKNLANPPSTGIWPLTEYPTLRNSTDSTQLWVLDQEGGLQSVQPIPHSWQEQHGAQQAMWNTSFYLQRPKKFSVATNAPGKALSTDGDILEDDEQNPFWSDGHPLETLM